MNTSRSCRLKRMIRSRMGRGCPLQRCGMYVSRVAAFFAAIEVVPRKFRPLQVIAEGVFILPLPVGIAKAFIESRVVLSFDKYVSKVGGMLWKRVIQKKSL